MTLTRVFKSGNSQAVRLPVGYHVDSKEVEIFKRDGDIIIREKPKNLAKAFSLLTHLPDDFFVDGRKDELPQEREF